MPKPPKKNAAGSRLRSSVLAAVPNFPERVGLPSRDSIVSVTIPATLVTTAAPERVFGSSTRTKSNG